MGSLKSFCQGLLGLWHVLNTAQMLLAGPSDVVPSRDRLGPFLKREQGTDSRDLLIRGCQNKVSRPQLIQFALLVWAKLVLNMGQTAPASETSRGQ